MSEPIHVISLGAGVQSSTIALMAVHGEISPMPNCAIFADTGDEPNEVYEWLMELEALLTFPVYRVSEGRLSDAIVNEWGHSQIPAWYRNDNGIASLGRRQCTKYFKILPIRRELRRRFPRQTITLWQGISLDEAHRMKPSGVKWLVHRWPLIEQRLKRGDCVRKLATWTNSTVPKSACVYCPYRSDEQWRASLKKPYDRQVVGKVESVLIPRGEFLHRSMVPIHEADLSTDEDHGQQVMFGNECEGMCGV